ncbi:hypothetical protein ALC56_01613, partial [Trachymyrmex septentrionalis]
FRDYIEYGCQTFQLHRDKKLFRCLEHFQWMKSIRISLSNQISIPINVMLAEAKEAPLRIRFNLLSYRYLIKSFSKHGSPMINSLNHLSLTVDKKKLRPFNVYPFSNIFKCFP